MQHSQYENVGYSKRIRLGRLCGITALLLTLIISNLAVWANSENQSSASLSAGYAAKAAAQVNFANYTRIMLFSSSTGQWVLSTFAQAKPGNEFYFNNQLYRVVDSDKAQVVLNVDTGRLFEADMQYDKASRRPASGDVVQVLDKDTRFVEHALFDTVQPGATVRFQGRAYSIKEDRTLVNTGVVFSSAKSPLQRIEITRSGLQHVMDRHTVSGTMTAGKSIFNANENIQVLIKSAEITAPVLEENGYLKRVFDAGRYIGIDGRKGKRISAYRVITTQSGKLVTAYPVVE